MDVGAEIGLVTGLTIVASGFIATGVFRMRRYDRRDAERRARKDAVRLRHHHRGALDVELDQGPGATRRETFGTPDSQLTRPEG